MEDIKKVPIEEEVKSAYIDYAMSVIAGRAIPDVRDGLNRFKEEFYFLCMSWVYFQINHIKNLREL